MPVSSVDAVRQHLVGHAGWKQADDSTLTATDTAIFVSQYPAERRSGVICVSPTGGLTPERTMGATAIRRPGVMIEVEHDTWMTAWELARAVWDRLDDTPDSVTVGADTANVQFTAMSSEPEPAALPDAGRTEARRVAFAQEWIVWLAP